MKIVVSATAPRLDAEVDPRFGRCQYLLIVDTESMEFEALENPALTSPGGAGIQAAQAVVDRGVGAVITGNCGPNAYQVLSSAHIDVLDGVSGSVREAVESYRRGELKAAAGPSAKPYSGMGGGRGGGMGGRRGGGGGRRV